MTPRRSGLGPVEPPLVEEASCGEAVVVEEPSVPFTTSTVPSVTAWERTTPPTRGAVTSESQVWKRSSRTTSRASVSPARSARTQVRQARAASGVIIATTSSVSSAWVGVPRAGSTSSSSVERSSRKSATCS